MALRLHREPPGRADDAGVKIREIEEKVRELRPEFSIEEVRTTSLLFAILKQGSSVPKLQWFTRYDLEFIQEGVERLRQRGLLFTGTLSTQYVLEQVPGSEDLVEKITGQKIVKQTVACRAPAGYDWRKNLQAPPVAPAETSAGDNGKENHMNEEINGGDEIENVQQTCAKTPGCPRKYRHTGKCAGAKTSRLSTDSPEARRAANAERMRLARAGNPGYARGSKAAPADRAKTNGHKPKTITAALSALTGDGHYKIEYEDETRQFNFEGIGREAFRAALKSAEAALAGGSNG